jgi:hypothetical protein
LTYVNALPDAACQYISMLWPCAGNISHTFAGLVPAFFFPDLLITDPAINAVREKCVSRAGAVTGS